MDTQKDYGLTMEGRDMVSKESQKYTNFDLIFSSPFRRTQETAGFFAETSGCNIILDERLVDVDLGDLDLQPYEVSAAFTKQNPDNNYIYPNGESFSQVLDRLISFIEEVNSKNKDKKILIVSHGFPCETLLDWIAGKSLKNWDKGIEKGKVFALKV